MSRHRLSYPQISHLDPGWVQAKIAAFKVEDFPSGDITSSALISDEKTTAKIISRQAIVFCGVDVLPYSFPDTCRVDLRYSDGMEIAEESVLAEVTGSSAGMLSHERLALNLLQHLCGIATHTRKLLNKNIPDGFLILDTRKTTPGLRLFEKYAVTVGGGTNHRLDLSSGILIKDNHIQAAGGLNSAVENARRAAKNEMTVELEVDNLEQLKEGMSLGVDTFLLDNMNPQQVKEAVKYVRQSKRGDTIFMEASGGIGPNNIEEYAATGIDAVSMSSLTIGAKPVDISMDFD